LYIVVLFSNTNSTTMHYMCIKPAYV
jgi:hypothetical protein